MTHARFATQRAAEDYAALCTKARGYPVRGVHVGGGRHVTLGDTPGPGWTTAFADVIEHPDGNAFAVLALDASAEERARLTTAERTEVAAKRAAAEPLDETWTRTEQETRKP